ncbi:M20/M25/M40 family metallo-hydrolase [Nocardia brasiliensis]|uniref:Vacuolar membrane protease n=1 Tax=Nocardia brasiliensis TaxID=37326 RepID=A0A6G9XVU2_NOCBR|nr:M20/M25/M40 family metallo-hydrolase [Nocardia brasiliensis]QIS05054.1 M20/M25/M40 family metallo-hydrolase [Nocardia brasiliensis]
MRIGPRLSGLLAFVVLLLIACATVWEQQPHGHRDESASAETFSAARAMRIIEEIARRPHPVGTPEHDRVRDHLVGELRALGLDTEIQEGVGRYPSGLSRDVLGMGHVANIIARLPGTNSTGTIFLTAHYDSVVSGPGANDDGSGVAAIMETVRALRASGTTVRNDVVVLLTDAEEQGLLGAEAFVAAGMDGRKTGVVVNNEARGAGGPVLLWRVTHPDGALVRAVADAAPHPNTDSLTTALAGTQTSSNTDFAAFEPGGLRVLDWAYAGRSAYYHNRFDDPAHVDRATLQQMGDNNLALVRELGDDDLTVADDDVDRAYFQLPFGVLIVLPLWVMIALAVATVLVVALVVRRFLRAGETSLGRVIVSGATALLTAPIAAGAVYGTWELVKFIRPEYRPLFVDPYRPEFFYVAMLTASAAALLAWFALARRLFGAAAAAAGLLSCLTLLGVALTALAPGTGHLLVVPTFAAAVGVRITFLVPERWQPAVLTVFLIPAAIFLGSATWPALQTGIPTAPFLVAPAVALVGGLLLLTLTKTWPARHGWTIPTAAVLLTVALAATGLAVDRFDEQHPLTSQLVYALDAEHNAARWISREAPDRWTRDLVGTAALDPRFAELWPTTGASGIAPAARLLPPVAEILADTTTAEQRSVTLRLRSQRDATGISLRYATAPLSLRVAGREVPEPPKKGIHFNAPPRDGIEVEITAPAGPLPLDLIDFTYLPDSQLPVLPPVPDDIYFRQDSTTAVFTSIPGL